MEQHNPRFKKYRKPNTSDADFEQELEVGDPIEIETPYGLVPATITKITFTPEEHRIFTASCTFILQEKDFVK